MDLDIPLPEVCAVGLAGVLVGLGLLVWLVYRGWSVLLLAPLAALGSAIVTYGGAPARRGLRQGPPGHGRCRRGRPPAAFEVVRDWVLGIGGGPLVSLAAATNVLAALTGSASGG
jgi:H+/gluconate symporter-like permease